MEQKIDQYIQTSLTDFGKGVNTERQLCLEVDGLKPVYRRIIYTALQLGSSRMIKTASITGNCLAKYHPHGSDSVDAVISSLVRWGIFDGQGNHGQKMIYGDDIVPAASRYTEAKINSGWASIFGELMPYVPYVEAEIEGNSEPSYLPTPLPMILLFSGLGIGYGANARYPMFTAKSMLDALEHDDPSLLRAPFGMEIDHQQSELGDLWNTGLGRICYKYKVESCGIASGYGTMISGSPEIFKPNLEKAFEDELAKGQVYILDQTANDIPQVFVGKSPNVRAINLEDIEDTCKKVAQYIKMFRLTVSDGNQVYAIPLKTWLTNCYNNYIQLVLKFKQSKIDNLNFDHEVYTWLPIITESLINNRDYDAEKLAEVNKCKLEVVKAILKKSISTLRNTDSTAKLKDIEASIKYYQGLDPDKYTKDLINRL